MRDSVRFSDYFFKVIWGNRFGYQVHFLKVEREKAEAERQRRLAQEKLEREKAELERQQRLEKEKVERELAEQERKMVKWFLKDQYFLHLFTPTHIEIRKEIKGFLVWTEIFLSSLKLNSTLWFKF